jgi:hypothetical protein
MTRAVRVEQVLLWVFVILAGIVIGAGFYEMRVTVPLWANSPPDSVWYWEAQRIVNLQYAPNSGMRFWIFLTPAHTLARSRELGLSPEEVARTASLWVTLSWFRAPIGLVGFIAGLRALTIPPEPRAGTGP